MTVGVAPSIDAGRIQQLREGRTEVHAGPRQGVPQDFAVCGAHSLGGAFGVGAEAAEPRHPHSRWRMRRAAPKAQGKRKVKSSWEENHMRAQLCSQLCSISSRAQSSKPSTPVRPSTASA